MKGIGFLYINEKIKIHPIIFGGGQQKGMRSGTENVPAIAGMSLAIEKVYESLEEDMEYLYSMKDYFVRGVLQIPDVKVNGLIGKSSAPHVVSLSVRGVRSEVLLHALEDKGIYVSAGSACASNKPSVSATLKAITVSRISIPCSSAPTNCIKNIKRVSVKTSSPQNKTIAVFDWGRFLEKTI